MTSFARTWGFYFCLWQCTNVRLSLCCLFNTSWHPLDRVQFVYPCRLHQNSVLTLLYVLFYWLCILPFYLYILMLLHISFINVFYFIFLNAMFSSLFLTLTYVRKYSLFDIISQNTFNLLLILVSLRVFQFYVIMYIMLHILCNHAICDFIMYLLL